MLRVDREVVPQHDRVAALLGGPAADPVEPRAVALAEHPVDQAVVARQVVLGQQADLERGLGDAGQPRLVRRPGLLVEVAARAGTGCTRAGTTPGRPSGDGPAGGPPPPPAPRGGVGRGRGSRRGRRRVVDHGAPGWGPETTSVGRRAVRGCRMVCPEANAPAPILLGTRCMPAGTVAARMLRACRCTASWAPSRSSTGRSCSPRSTAGSTRDRRRPTPSTPSRHTRRWWPTSTPTSCSTTARAARRSRSATAACRR